FQSAFSCDLDVQVRNALGGVDGQQNQEIPPRRFVRAERGPFVAIRSEEHTSELQSRFDLVCRLLLEKKNSQPTTTSRSARQRGRSPLPPASPHRPRRRERPPRAHPRNLRQWRPLARRRRPYAGRSLP